MLHYLFTNDLRRNMWPDILVESAKLIRDDKVPDQSEDKSKNNYINTQQSYLCINRGSKANEVCCNGDVKAVILNFVNRFQYPNARTSDSYRDSSNDGMSVAPLRLAVQLLFILNQIDESEAHISYAELAKYIICDQGVATGVKDAVALAQQIIADRKNGVQIPAVPDSEALNDFGVEWKHCPRQIKELFGLLEYVPFIKLDGADFKLVMSSDIDPYDAKLFFHIVNNKEKWSPATGTWQEIRDSYCKYMDAGIELCISAKDITQKQNFEEEFVKWWVEVEKKEENTARNKYLVYLRCLNKPYAEPNHSTWPGIFPYLFGSKSEKEVVEVGRLSEFDRLFAPFCNIFTDEGCPAGANQVAYDRCVQWVKDVSAWACLPSAFKAYRKFLQWREAQNKPEDKKDEMPPNVDRLSIALKLFAEKRYEAEWQGCANKEGFLSIFDAASLKPADIAALTLDDFYKEFLLKVWAFTNGGSRRYGQLDDAAKVVYRDFVVRLKTSLESFDNYFPPNTKCPDGMGVGVLSELLMRFWPGSCCSYNKSLMHEGLVAVGMAEGDFVWPKTPSIYQEFMGKCAVILRKMEEMNLPRKPIPGNEEAPDYITVNEFLWFASENKDLIKEKVMSKAMKKPTAKKINTGKAEISNLLNNEEDSLMTMLIAGLLTKPLAILAGVSGTGKSRMVRHLAYKTCLDEDLKPNGESAPGNFKMVQVKPSWHDSADLLGYRSAVNEKHEYVSTDFVKFVLKAHAYPKTPFFVCLDEMNLAPVEHYFAEFLSACESIRKSDVTKEWTSDPIVAATDFDNNVLNLGGDVLFESSDTALDAELKKTKARIEKEGLFIPRNLFVVGTVNMDDSTGGFSRKVLDRAMTVVMNEVNLEDLKKDDKDLTLSDDNLFTTVEIAKFINREDFDKGMLENGFIDQLEDIRLKLAKTPFALAYRFARETCMYKKALLSILDSKEVLKKSDGSAKMDGGVAIDADRACGDIALDHMILMKLLPRLTGTTEQRSDVLKDIKEYLGKLVKDKKVSAVTLDEMEERAKSNGGYLSFWP